MNLRNVLWEEYNEIVKQEENYWFQQARGKWLTMGDNNSSFFHQSTLMRRRRNKISSLIEPDGNWIYDDVELQSLVKNFYDSLYTSSQVNSYLFSSVTRYPSITYANKVMLAGAVSMEGVKMALYI